MPPGEPRVRSSAIAGRWYPGHAPTLAATIAAYLRAAPVVDLPGPLLALIAPHAGYSYSGPTAAHAFAQIAGKPFTRVVLLGPLHRPIRGAALGAYMVPAEDAYRTPLGDVPIDRTFLTALGGHTELTTVQRDEEHALEIELPFLQVALPRFSLAPVMFGEHIAERGALLRLQRFAAALAALWDAKTLLVVSTDLTHADDYRTVEAQDRLLADQLARFDVDGLAQSLRRSETQACGATALVVALRAAQLLGARGAAVLSRTTSAAVTGDTRPGAYTVGYLAAAVYA